jgi:hypothetical protein
MPLTGKCNKCGLCCYVKDPRGEMLKCHNLIVIGKPGDADATFCGAWDGRFPNMPVYLVDEQRNLRGHTVCAGDNTQDELDDLLYKNLIGNECTLKLED